MGKPGKAEEGSSALNEGRWCGGPLLSWSQIPAHLFRLNECSPTQWDFGASRGAERNEKKVAA